MAGSSLTRWVAGFLVVLYASLFLAQHSAGLGHEIHHRLAGEDHRHTHDDVSAGHSPHHHDHDDDGHSHHGPPGHEHSHGHDGHHTHSPWVDLLIHINSSKDQTPDGKESWVQPPRHLDHLLSGPTDLLRPGEPLCSPLPEAVLITPQASPRPPVPPPKISGPRRA
jgi:hypothetical protein